MSVKHIAIGASAFFLTLATGIRSCSVVPAGHVRVLDTFGSVRGDELNPGLNFPVNPLSRRVKFDTRTKELKENMTVPTKEGIMAPLDVSIIYHVSSSEADQIYKSIGAGYESVIIEPFARNAVRDVIAGFSSEDLYNPNRNRIEREIYGKLNESYVERGLVLESVLLRDVELPLQVTAAINQKISAKQAAEQMQYTLQKEEQEAKRKEVEARGIAEAQKIVAEGLTREYLQWRYITTLEHLTTSPNNTFIITPYDAQTLIPMLLPMEAK